MKNENVYPTYKEFKEFFAKKEKPLNNFIAIPCYVLSLIGLTLLLIIMVFVVVSVFNSSKRISKKYPPEKYRKVVKEGILWDRVEWHER